MTPASGQVDSAHVSSFPLKATANHNGAPGSPPSPVNNEPDQHTNISTELPTSFAENTRPTTPPLSSSNPVFPNPRTPKASNLPEKHKNPPRTPASVPSRDYSSASAYLSSPARGSWASQSLLSSGSMTPGRPAFRQNVPPSPFNGSSAAQDGPLSLRPPAVVPEIPTSEFTLTKDKIREISDLETAKQALVTAIDELNRFQQAAKQFRDLANQQVFQHKLLQVESNESQRRFEVENSIHKREIEKLVVDIMGFDKNASMDQIRKRLKKTKSRVREMSDLVESRDREIEELRTALNRASISVNPRSSPHSSDEQSTGHVKSSNGPSPSESDQKIEADQYSNPSTNPLANYSANDQSAPSAQRPMYALPGSISANSHFAPSSETMPLSSFPAYQPSSLAAPAAPHNVHDRALNNDSLRLMSSPFYAALTNNRTEPASRRNLGDPPTLKRPQTMPSPPSSGVPLNTSATQAPKSTESSFSDLELMASQTLINGFQQNSGPIAPPPPQINASIPPTIPAPIHTLYGNSPHSSPFYAPFSPYAAVPPHQQREMHFGSPEKRRRPSSSSTISASSADDTLDDPLNTN